MNRLFILFAGLLAGCSTLSKGKVGPDYKVLAVSYIDSSGLYWLEKLDDPVTNGCLDKSGTYRLNLCSKSIENKYDSAAEEACEAYGARLPSINDYERLLKDFQKSGSLDEGLSERVYHDVAMAFKDDMPYAAWTSTVSPSNAALAQFFSWSRGPVDKRFEYRSVALPVRCVRKP